MFFFSTIINSIHFKKIVFQIFVRTLCFFSTIINFIYFKTASQVFVRAWCFFFDNNKFYSFQNCIWSLDIEKTSRLHLEHASTSSSCKLTYFWKSFNLIFLISDLRTNAMLSNALWDYNKKHRSFSFWLSFSCWWNSRSCWDSTQNNFVRKQYFCSTTVNFIHLRRSASQNFVRTWEFIQKNYYLFRLEFANFFFEIRRIVTHLKTSFDRNVSFRSCERKK